MNATADDWESFAQIAPEVERSLGPQERGVVEEAIRGAFSKGFVTAKTGAWSDAVSLDGEFESFWFSMTKRGREIWQTDSVFYWPEGEPNQSPEPTATPVTSPARQEPRQT